MGNTLIDWTDKVWNPCTGCEKIAAECRECYAEKMARRLQAMGNPRYVNGFKMTLHPEALKEPFEWKGNVMCFLPSMGDLFHDDVPESFIDQVIDVVEQTPNIRRILPSAVVRLTYGLELRAVTRTACSALMTFAESQHQSVSSVLSPSWET